MATFFPNIYLDNLAKDELGKDSLNGSPFVRHWPTDLF